MSDPYFQQLFAERVGGANYGKGTAIYKFEKIKRAKRKALADHPERTLIDFGIGENDEMAPAAIRAVMAEEINQPENRGYADNGPAGVQAGRGPVHAAQLRRRARPDQGSQPLHRLEDGAGHAAGRVHQSRRHHADDRAGLSGGRHAHEILRRTVYALPLLPENDFLPDLDAIPADVRSRAKLLVLCYPNSPTGKVATRDFYQRVIDFASANDIVVVQDAAHIMLTFEGEPLSFLSVPGAKDVGVEIHSMSKGFHMIGWRMGWVCGHERIVQAFADVKDNSDSGQFLAIQKAAAAALDDPEIPRQVRAKYERRCRKLVDVLNRSGFTCHMPGGTYFIYAKSPRGIAGGPHVRNGRSGQPVPDHRALDLHGPLGRRRAAPAVLGDLRSARRSRRRRPDGRHRRAPAQHPAAVLTLARTVASCGPQRAPLPRERPRLLAV